MLPLTKAGETKQPVDALKRWPHLAFKAHKRRNYSRGRSRGLEKTNIEPNERLILFLVARNRKLHPNKQ